jgi:flagellar basal-body rod modification protein FlgD
MSELQIGTTGAAAAAKVASSLSQQTAASRASSSSNGSSTSTDSSSTITANDFLTLLVTELKNQDPTQPTDPSAYIQQLVGVNSLQQLIQINSGISSLDTAVGATTTSTSGA